MLRSLTSAISGLQYFQQRMDIIGNNIANVNTTAFKASRTHLVDAFSDTLRASSAAGTVSSGQSALQIGSGVQLAAVHNFYTQGAFARTGVNTDLAVAGNGFFIVRDTLSDSEFATRAGDFRVDGNGYLVSNTGLRVRGYEDAGLTTYGDIQVDSTGAPPGTDPNATLVSFSINGDGKINVNLSDGTQFERGQILLQNFKDPQGLIKEGFSLYSGISNAGPLGFPSPANTNGIGKIQSGALELSNVDLANEFTDLIVTQRAYQANARIITTSDEMLQELVNLKR